MDKHVCAPVIQVHPPGPACRLNSRVGLNREGDYLRFWLRGKGLIERGLIERGEVNRAFTVLAGGPKLVV